MVHTLDLKFLGKEQTIASYVVETLEGPCLVESGPYSCFPEMEKALKKIGYSVSDIKHVFLTHIHFDHAGAAWKFAEHGANIYVHPFGAKHLIAPAKLYDSARRIYGDDMERLWGEMNPIPKNQVIAFKDKERIRIGKVRFRAWHTPGHAKHHIAWQVDNDLFSGDVGGIKIGEGLVVPPCPPPDINIEDWTKSINLILSKRFDSLYLTHFGQVLNPRPHLVELRGRLKNWANWMKPFLDAGMEDEELTEKFRAYVDQQVGAYKLTKKQVIAYENANPAAMSVAGLRRYWSLKE